MRSRQKYTLQSFQIIKTAYILIIRNTKINHKTEYKEMFYLNTFSENSDNQRKRNNKMLSGQ